MRNCIYIFVLFAVFALQGAVEYVCENPGPLGRKAVLESAETGGEDNAADSVVAMYRRRGYLMAEATVTLDTSGVEKIVRIEVDSGVLSVIAGFSSGGLDESPIEVPFEEGDPFMEGRVAFFMEGLIEYFEDRGFPFTRVSIDSLSIGPVISDSLPVVFEIGIVKGDSVMIGAIVLPEKARTRSYVVRRLMMIDPPELYSQSKIEKGLERIGDISYLSVVAKPEILLDESGIWLLRVEISENRAVTINGVLGYDPGSENSYGLTGHLDGIFRNMWGTGRSLKVLWDSYGRSKYRVGADYMEPWILGGPGDLYFEGEYYMRDSTYTESELDFEYKLPLSFDFSILMGVGYRGISPDSIGQEIYDIPHSDEYNILIGLEYESLNPRVNPEGGIDARLSVAPSYIERSGPEHLFDELDRYEAMLRTEADFESVLRLFKNNRFYLGVHGRSLLAAGPSPISDRYLMGGWSTVRGYREDQFSSEHLGWGNLEWRFLLGGKNHAFAFLDAGLIKPSDEDIYEKIGYGLGFRMNTAIGRWSVSYGIAGGSSLTSGLIHVALNTDI